MMGDMPGPTFWSLDGCNMDNEFAFSFHRTREEFDAEQREYEEFNKRFNERRAEQNRLGVTSPGGGWMDPDYAWENSFSPDQAPDMPIALRLFTIGSKLCDLIVDLKHPTEDREHIDKLNRDFANLRETAQSTDRSFGEAVIEPVVDRFCETLESAAALHPKLEGQCSELQSRLRQFLDKVEPQ
jgi:hypothetical protein